MTFNRKPIFIVNIPLCESKEQFELVTRQFESLKEDYHVLIVEDIMTCSKIRFKMYSDHEIEPIEMEKLKEIVNAK